MKNPKIKIKEMTISDLNIIKDSLENNFNNLWTYKIFKEELANNNSKYLVLLYDNEIICFRWY